MRINYFSPLPELRTEIANMSATILPELGTIAEVRAWTPQAEWRADRAQNYDIRRFDPEALPMRELNWGDVSIYNIGNDARFHREIFDVARRIPGIHILHDVRLAHFFGAYAEQPGPNRDYFLAEMKRAGVAAEAERFIAGHLPFATLAEQEPMTLATLEPAIGAIFHNRAAVQTLRHQTAKPLFYLPLPLTQRLLPPTAQPARRRDARQPIRLILFGFIGRNRCLPEILHALAGMPDRKAQVLDVYGTLEDQEAIQALVEQLRLEEQVTLHGFVPDAELDVALARADLVINLRNPTMGEASASQLRTWASGLPSLVSDVGWYSTLSADAVFRVTPGQEVAEIRAHLQAFRTSPEPYRTAGMRGRAIVEQDHQASDYARGLLRIARQTPRMHARRTTMVMARRAAAGLLDLAQPAQIARLTPSVATRIHELAAGTPSEP